MSKPILLSGVKPSGSLHIGNYIGAIKQFVDLQKDHKVYVMIADYHALNTMQDKEKMLESIYELVASYIVAGIDESEAVIFKQSDVPEHTELAWIFNTLTTMPYLMRAHAFKDAEAKSKEISVGTFAYPMLMAADILLYNTDVVPVGKDQKQHIEITRDVAKKFNSTFEEVFKLPKEIIPEDIATIPGTDGEKMSKSYGNTIPLFGSDEEIDKAVMSVVTDSKEKGEALDPDTDLVFTMHKYFSAEMLEELRKKYEEGSIGYKESKEILAKNIKALIAPMREKRNELLADRSAIDKILENGAEKARGVARQKMIEVKRAIGVIK